MATSRTASRGKGGTASRTTKRPPSRRPAARSKSRRPAPRRTKRGPGPIVRARRGVWNLLARGVESLARTVGRTREIEAGVRRDGIAFALIAVGVVAAAGMWWRTGGQLSQWLENGVRTVVGAGAIALPLAVLVVGVTLMR